MYIVPMEAVIGALGGFRGVRAELLVALKKAQPITAQELERRLAETRAAYVAASERRGARAAV